MSAVPKEVERLAEDNLDEDGWSYHNSDCEAVLTALGGSWDIEHTHTWYDDERPDLRCTDDCDLATGRHVRRYRWRSDPI